MPRRSFRRLLLAIMAATFAMFAGAVSPASADQGDKQGWSLGSDPRKRVFLRFVPANDGPRVLVLGCLRDIDSFIVLSEQDIGIGHGQAATLTLANALSSRASSRGMALASDGLALPAKSTPTGRHCSRFAQSLFLYWKARVPWCSRLARLRASCRWQDWLNL